MSKFDLTAALASAEAGDVALWEDIARHLLKKQPKPKRSRFGTYITWAHVTLKDGREFLTSHAALKTEAETLAAHQEYAQFRARMEDSGDNGRNRVFLNPKKKAVPVRSAEMLTDASEIERVRNLCFEQRGERMGWLQEWRAGDPDGRSGAFAVDLLVKFIRACQHPAPQQRELEAA